MEYIKEISIKEAIIHILDGNADEPIMNESLLELNDEINNFLIKHIQKALKDEELKYAVFNDGDNLLRECSQDYLSGRKDFLTTSKELSVKMFSMIKFKNALSCDLIIVSILTEYGEMLSVLKMDYIKNFVHSINFVDNKIKINIIPQLTGLPGSGQKVSKCAFIKKMEEGQAFELMVIDKPVALDKENKMAAESSVNYFTENYLNCRLIQNERDITRSFVKAAENWTRNVLNENAEASEFVRSTIKKKLREEESIDINLLSEELFKDQQETKKNFAEYISSQGVQENVPVDKEWVDKKLKRVRLKIDKDIDVYINEDTYNNDSRFEIVRNGDGSINMVIKRIVNYIEK